MNAFIFNDVHSQPTEFARHLRIWLQACLHNGMIPNAYDPAGSYKEKFIDPRIALILRVIGERIVDVGPALTSTSKLLGLSKPRWRRLFKREIGEAFQRYLLKTRMSRAAELTRDSTLPIKEIAFASGYHDVSNFYRDFKKVHAQTPRQMRAQPLAKLSALEDHLGIVQRSRRGPESRP